VWEDSVPAVEAQFAFADDRRAPPIPSVNAEGVPSAEAVTAQVAAAAAGSREAVSARRLEMVLDAAEGMVDKAAGFEIDAEAAKIAMMVIAAQTTAVAAAAPVTACAHEKQRLHMFGPVRV